MRDATAVLTAAIVALAAPAQAGLFEIDATLSIESLETLFPPAPGFNAAFGTLPPGHGVASVTSSGAITGFAGLGGLSGRVTVGDVGTDAFFDLWEVDIAGLGSPMLSGAPLHGPLALVIGDARRITGPFYSSTTPTTLTWFRTRSGMVGPGLGGSFITTSTSDTLRVEFDTWTTGMLTLTNLTPVLTGFTSPAVTGFDARTADGLGVVQLVTPIRISSSTSPLRLGAFGVLRIHFLPEPASVVMLLVGVCFLLVFGRRRMAKSGR